MSYKSNIEGILGREFSLDDVIIGTDGSTAWVEFPGLGRSDFASAGETRPPSVAVDAVRQSPPGVYSDGEAYAVSAGASGDFLGHDGAVALRRSSAWVFLGPFDGWIVWDRETQSAHAYDAVVGDWTQVVAGASGAQVLSALAPLDGSGSGLDADLLDGQHGSYYLDLTNSTGDLPAARFTDTSHGSRSGGSLHSAATTSVAGFMSASDKTKLDGIESGATADMTASEVLTALLMVDGAASGLDADLLDGQHGSYYLDLANAVGALPAGHFTSLSHGALGGGSLHADATTSVAGFMSASDKAKLDGIESGATTDMTANEVLAALLTVDGAGSGLDADLLDGHDGLYYLDLANSSGTLVDARHGALGGGSLHSNATTSVAGFMSAADKTKLDGVESGATGDQTGSEVLSLLLAVDGASSSLDADLLDGQHGSYYLDLTNSSGNLPGSSFTDASHGSRSGGSLHSNATTSVAGFMSATDKAKLDGVETGATADMTANEVLAALLTVDGASSGLDADLLDGQHGSHYLSLVNATGDLPAARFTDASHGARSGGSLHSAATPSTAGFMSSSDKAKLDTIDAGATADMTASEILAALLTVDGAGSGLDADLLDGQHGSYFAPVASPALTGAPTAPTAAPGTSTTQLATTAFVTLALAALDELELADGSAATPSLRFSSSPGSGLYWEADRISVSVDGTAVASFHPDGLFAADAVGPGLLNEASSQNNPTLVPDKGDPTSGVGSNGSGTVVLVANGQPALTASEDAGVTTTTIHGDLVVQGTTVTVSSEQVTIADNVLVLNSDVVGAPVADSGIEVERGSSTNAQLVWDEAADEWQAGLVGSRSRVWTASNDGAASGLDADLLDGQHGSYYLDLANSTGDLPAARFTDTSHGSRSGGSLHSAATTSVAGFMSATDKTKLDGIETGATADMTASEVLAALLTVDGAASGLDADLLDGQHGSHYLDLTNSTGDLPAARFTDTSHGSRSGGSLHSAATTSVAGFMSASDKAKLDGIESGATTDMTANEILAALLTVDGAGSGLDADTLDGISSASFAQLSGATFTGVILASVGSEATPGLAFSGDTGTGVWRQAAGSLSVSSAGAEKLRVHSTGATVYGSLSATTKSFLVPHRGEPGKMLRHGSLEGPENGVYVRGRAYGHGSVTIKVPEYWSWLINHSTVTVSVTPMDGSPMPRATYSGGELTLTHQGAINCHYHVFAERADVPRLEVVE